MTEDAAGRGIVQAVVLDFVEYVELPASDPDGFPVLAVEYETQTDGTEVRVCDGLQGSGEPITSSVTVDGANYRPLTEAQTTIVPKPEAWFDIVPDVSNGPVTVYIHSALGDVQGWSFSLCHDAEKVSISEYRVTPEGATVNQGNSPDFLWMEVADDGQQTGVIQAFVTSFRERVELPGIRDGGFPALEVEYDVLEESTITFCESLQGSGEPVDLVVTIDGLTSRLPMQHATSTLIVDPYSDTMAFRAEPPESTEVVTVKLYSEEAAVEGWAFSLCHTASAATLVEYQTSPELGELVLGEAPEFLLNEVSEVDPFVVVQQRVVLGPVGPGIQPIAIGPFPDGLALLDIRYDVTTDEPLKFCDHVGSIQFENFVAVEGVQYVPRTRVAATLVQGALGSRFVRGDADLNRAVNLSDAVFILRFLFLGGSEPPCLDAADVNDVARIEISDSIYLLRYLFLGGPPPPPPFERPGVDISPETALGCERGL